MNTQPPTDILAALRAPFDPSRISWRPGATTGDKTKAIALAYIDARDVMHRLDAVCGAGWQCEYVPMHNGTCCCRIGIRIGGEWVWRSNGAVNVADSDKPDAQEMAEKGSYSDAFKRAAVLFGVGQYLYDVENIWVPLLPKGKSYVIDFSKCQRDLDRALSKAAGLIAPPPRTQPTETPPTNGNGHTDLPPGTKPGSEIDNPVAKSRKFVADADTFADVVKYSDGILKRMADAAKSPDPSPWKHAGQTRDLLHFVLLRMKETATTQGELDSTRRQAKQWDAARKLDADSVVRVIEAIDAKAAELELAGV